VTERTIHMAFVPGDGMPLMAELVRRGEDAYGTRLHAMDREEVVYESPYSRYPYFIRLTWREIVGMPLPKHLIAEIAG
jgi:hypothetical protein